MLAMLAFMSALLNLHTIRKSIVILTLFIIPFMVLQLDISQWFKLLFYSLNGTVAPIVLGIGYQLNKDAVIISSLGGVLLAFIFISNPAIDVIAAGVVLLSFMLNFALSKK